MLVDLVGTKQKINFVKCLFSILVKADSKFQFDSK